MNVPRNSNDPLGPLLDALDRRIGFRALLRHALDEPVPGGASWAYVFGSAALILFFVQLGTGLVLASVYAPTPSEAWASVDYLERSLAFGRFVRALHHHAAGGMVIVVGLHLAQTALYGAYKAPREVNWLSGLGLLGLVLAFALTGYLLPWDQTGYFATKVATSIAGTVPIVGGAVQRFLQGGNDYGHLTLTRFYALHVILLPLLTLGLLGAHVLLFRRHGVTPSARLDAEALAKVEPFWPKQVALDAVFAALVVGAIAWLALTVGAPLEAPADPASDFLARPEWYFLFLFQLLKYFEGPLQIVGTVILPGLVTTFLVALPFLDRSPDRRVRARKPFVGALAVLAAALGGLSALAISADRADPEFASAKALARREAARARALAAEGVPPEGATYMASHDPLILGERVFRAECAECHAYAYGAPKKPRGPDLTGYRSRAWVRQVLRDPDSPRLFGRSKVYGMESFAALPPAELDRLVDFVMERRRPDAPPVEASPAAALVERHDCGSCHDFEEAYGLDGPSLLGYLGPAWVRGVVDRAGADHLYGEVHTMPNFGERLPERERAAVTAFLLSLEAIEVPERWPWVDDPSVTPPRKRESDR